MTSRDDRLIQGRLRGSGALGLKADGHEHLEICFIWRGNIEGKLFWDFSNGKSIPRGILGKNYIMLHMLIHQEWKGRSITICMNERVGLTDHRM